MKVQLYREVYGDSAAWMEPDDEGEWIYIEDYQKLEAHLQDINKENLELKQECTLRAMWVADLEARIAELEKDK